MKKNGFQTSILKVGISLLGIVFFIFPYANAQTTKLTLDLTKSVANVSPMLYGLMTEEINHSYDGGLYAELIRNRIFKDNPTKAEGWSLVNGDTVNSKASIKLIATTPDNVPYDERRH